MSSKPNNNDEEIKKLITELIERGLIIKLNDDKYMLTGEGYRVVSKLDKEKLKQVLIDT